MVTSSSLCGLLVRDNGGRDKSLHNVVFGHPCVYMRMRGPRGALLPILAPLVAWRGLCVIMNSEQPLGVIVR